MKALLIATLISSTQTSGVAPAIGDQMHIWFEGTASHVECDRTKAALTSSGGDATTEQGSMTTSVKKIGPNGTVERSVICVKFN